MPPPPCQTQDKEEIRLSLASPVATASSGGRQQNRKMRAFGSKRIPSYTRMSESREKERDDERSVPNTNSGNENNTATREARS
jgi:hypothetical protein